MNVPPSSVSGEKLSSGHNGTDTNGGPVNDSTSKSPIIRINIPDPSEREVSAIEALPAPDNKAPEEQRSAVEDKNAAAPPFPSPPPSPKWSWRVPTRLVSAETLRTYGIVYHLDENPALLVVDRHVPDYEREFLKKHTEEQRKKTSSREENPWARPPPLPSFVRREPRRRIRPSAPSPVRIHVQPDSPASIPESSALSLESNKVAFEKWMAPDNHRGESVLDVAIQSRKTSETTTSSGKVISAHTSTSSSSNAGFGVPVRLAINSFLVRGELTKITGHSFGVYNMVMHEPWKVIVTYDKDIKKRLQDLEVELNTLKEEQAKENDRTKDKDQAKEKIQPKAVDQTKDREETKPNVNREYESDYDSLDGDEQYHPLETKLNSAQDKISHLKCLVDFIDEDLKPVFEFRRALKEGTVKEIAFRDLWHLFAPGDTLVTSGPRHERQAYKVFYTCGGRPLLGINDGFGFDKALSKTSFTLDSYCIDFDNSWIGPVHETISIPPYEGTRPITALPMFSHTGGPLRKIASAFPVRFLEEPEEEAIAHLVNRGKRNRELTPFSHKRYCGVAASVSDPEYLNSEIIIDTTQDTGNNLIGIFRNIAVHNDEVPDGCAIHEPCYQCRDIFGDGVIDKDLASRYTQDQHLLSKRDAGDNSLTDDHFMLFPASTDAFVLRERDTFAVYIDLIKDLDGDHGESLKTLKKQSGFEDLVLPEGHGDLVEALVKSHRSTRNRRDEASKVQVDLIDGKGEGLIILLHGVPGVGKTSTAECVAAYTRRPLYPITCANIGLEPEEVEKKLTGPEGHFRRAQQWNCVVLLDEADVFLARRETRASDAKRNALVSVFLRTLEYYPGILILTTNRVGAFDEAVISRIQLFLYYPPLDEDKTMEVWRVHINRVRSSGLINLDNEDKAIIMAFARKEYAGGRRWNGRQIRNFFQTAISLATYDATKWHQQSIEDGEVDKDSKPDKPRLTTRTLEIVAKTSGKFIDYINSTVPDGSHQKQQLDEGNRNDDWEETPKKSR